ncbi:MAG: T9SS type A sorting domain-containing protein, partial [Rhodothermales bacterium]|nr:T9SS type A sorting domain-containing protein [Rhodothermales bacterium]
VALSGDGQYAVVGAPGDDDTFFLSGSAYVFERSGTTWTQQAKLNASDAGDADRFGRSVALNADGTVALVGASLAGETGAMTGAAYVFVRTGATWSEEAKLTASDGADGDGFGGAVALSADGETALIGAVGAGTPDFAGAAYVFSRDGGTWTEEARLTAADPAADDALGRSVALSADGQYAVAGAYQDDDAGASSGAVYVFERDGSAWSQQAKLTASDAAAGDQFGYSVVVSDGGTVVLGGANAEDDGGSDAGAAYVFVRNGTTWTEDEKLTAPDAAALDFFARTVALDGDGTVALVGADGDDDNGPDSGSAYVFELSPMTAAEGAAPPASASLSAAVPNPFREQTRLALTLGQPERVRVSLFDVLGREVRVLHDGVLVPGVRDVLVPARALPSGVYVVRVATPTHVESQRVVLQR